MSTVMFCRLLARAPTTRSIWPRRPGRRVARHGDAARVPVRYCAVMLSGFFITSLGRAGGHDLAAMDAGRRAHVDEVIGVADRILVMLDDDHRVAEIAQPLQRRQQPVVVALMQADRRLVEHVEHAGEAGADLRGQADALALAARQRAGGARQGQIFEPDIAQEAQPLVDLLQDALRRCRAASAISMLVERAEPVGGVERSRGRATSLMSRPPILTASASGLSRWPWQASHGASCSGSGRALPCSQALSVSLPAPLHVGDDALERPRRRIGAHAVVVVAS